ncbi:hypothetical protein Bbelb_074010 [Branchiostoma belcheri]|nr:hypothetical protein Bbelb_074010 [Branchiostoma belcheri]
MRSADSPPVRASTSDARAPHGKVAVAQRSYVRPLSDGHNPPYVLLRAVYGQQRGQTRASVRGEYHLRTESYGFGSTQTRRRTLSACKTFSTCGLRIHHPCVRVRATRVPRTCRAEEARVRDSNPEPGSCGVAGGVVWRSGRVPDSESSYRACRIRAIVVPPPPEETSDAEEQLIRTFIDCQHFAWSHRE